MGSSVACTSLGMHITIPDARLERAVDMRSYHVFNIYVNGHYHASVRYSQLRSLHDQLQSQLGYRVVLPAFPPKRIRTTLNDAQLDDRRVALQAYFQAVIQHPLCVAAHTSLNQFLLQMQVASFRPTTNQTAIDVYMCDGTKTSLKCAVNDATPTILQLYAQHSALDTSMLQYFGLFLVAHNPADANGGSQTQNCVKHLMPFESPYISLQLLNQRVKSVNAHQSSTTPVYRVMIMKWYWNIDVDKVLLTNTTATKILFAQCKNDIENDCLSTDSDTRQLLKSLAGENRWREYIQTCEPLLGYGMWRMVDCVSDYPHEDTPVTVSIGERQIVLGFKSIDDADTPGPSQRAATVTQHMYSFRATRIRVWRIFSKDSTWTQTRFEFEYLFAKDHFQWVSLQTQQAALMSECLQAITADILHTVKDKVSAPKPMVVVGDASTPRVDDAHPITNGVHMSASTGNGQVHVSPRAKSTPKDEQKYESLNDVLTQMGSSLLGGSRQRRAAEHAGMNSTNTAFDVIKDEDL